MDEKKKKGGGKEPPDPVILAEFSKNMRRLVPNNKVLAEATGISQQGIADYVNGVSLPRADYLYKIANVLKVGMDELLTGHAPEKPSDCPVKCNKEMAVLCDQVKKVIESKTNFSGALRENILAFHDAVGMSDTIKEIKVEQQNDREQFNRQLDELRQDLKQKLRKNNELHRSENFGTIAEAGIKKIKEGNIVWLDF